MMMYTSPLLLAALLSVGDAFVLQPTAGSASSRTTAATALHSSFADPVETLSTYRQPMPTGGTGGGSMTVPFTTMQSAGLAGPDPFAPPLGIKVQGGSLRTWSVPDFGERVKVTLASEGRPCTANMELWHGPDYTATTTKIFLEDGCLRPFHAIVETPKNMNTVAIYNTGTLEYPFSAQVESGEGLDAPMAELRGGRVCQGGSIASFTFDSTVESVLVCLQNEGRTLQARIELMQGPNNDKQVIEFYSSDGLVRPFHAIIETPGIGNVVRLINQASVEFPFMAWVEPCASIM